MNGNKKILSTFLAFTLALAAMGLPASAANQGIASIGFSTGNIYYIPAGISGVEGTLNLDFGNHPIGSSNVTQTYRSINNAGYVVSNERGGISGYRVTLGLSSFDNGLEGATLTLQPDAKGLVSGTPGATDAPKFMGGQGYVQLEADGQSSVVVMEATTRWQDPNHTALGRWGFNFYGDLKVYTNTILAGSSRSVMTWQIDIV